MHISECAIRQTHSSAIPNLTPATHRTKALCGAVLALVSLLLLASPAFAQTKLTPPTLSFGSYPVGETSGPKAATFKNTQKVPLTIDSIVFSGTAPADYAWGGNCPISPNTLGAGWSCNITVTL